uniref:hypothetical protein n=1 Tax=Dematophora necatrix TaxID=2751867 RepID=UPI0030FF1AAD
MSKNKHTTLEGLKEILAHRASLNGGLSENLKISFPPGPGPWPWPWPSGIFFLIDIIPVKRVEIEANFLSNLSPDWVAGFSTGESNFYIAISGTKVWLRFSIAQDSKDKLLLKSLVEFLIVVI